MAIDMERKRELDAALAVIDVESYLEREGVDFRRSHGTRGLQLNLRECPACHGEGFKTYINAETGLGNCFHGACAKKFNRFWLVKCVSGLAGEALDSHIKAVAELQGWLPKTERVKLVLADLKLPSKTFDLPFHGQNLQYLVDRGITIASAAHFNLAFCQGGWWSYKLDDGTEKWVSYDDRVIIPIHDLEGRLVSFQGRDVSGEKLPKYLFPVGYAVAGSHLYNGRNFVDGVTDHLCVGEGAFDCIAIHQAFLGAAGVSRVLPIATFGMHLSDGPGGQIEKLMVLQTRGIKTITFMWDGEKKAITAAIKMGLKLVALGFKVRIAVLPEGKDPNEVPVPQLISAFFKAFPLSRASALKMLVRLGVSHH
jgi:DNA primase